MSEYLQESIEIAAPPSIVWEVLKSERKQYKTVVEPLSDESNYLLTQTFPTPLGDAQVKMIIHEEVNKWMDFQMIQSPAVKRLRGHWSFFEHDGKTKLMIIIDDLEPSVALPKFLVKSILGKTLRDRLKVIKKVSEQ